MGRESTLATLVLTSEEETRLNRLRQSRTEPARDVKRAEVLWRCHSGAAVAGIMKSVGMTRKSGTKWIRKPLNTAVSEGRRQTPQASPKSLGFVQATWV